MQQPSTEQTQEEIERNLRAALAAALGEPEDDPAARDLTHDILYMVRLQCWSNLALTFQAGRLVGVGGKTYQRERVRNIR